MLESGFGGWGGGGGGSTMGDGMFCKAYVQS